MLKENILETRTLCKNYYKKCNTWILFRNDLWKHISSVKLTFIMC